MSFPLYIIKIKIKIKIKNNKGFTDGTQVWLCSGRSVNFNPERKGFMGLAPTTLLQTLIQTKRWAEGDLQIFLSSYCPFLYGHGRIPLKLQISYCCYLLWALNCWATLYYVVVPCYCLLRGISLFPKVSTFQHFNSIWFLLFLKSSYIFHAYSYQATGSYLLHMYLLEDMHTASGSFTGLGEQ